MSHHVLGGELEAAAPSRLLPATAACLPLLLLAEQKSAHGLMSAGRVEQEGSSEGEGPQGCVQGCMRLHEAS